MESTENVYYAEGSEIIEEDNAWGMQDVVIVDNENINWQEESDEISDNYNDASANAEQTLTEDEIYLSGHADDSEADKTEYYSILETTYQDEEYNDNVSANIVVNVDDEEEMILPHQSLVEEGKENVGDEDLDNQVILYSSDDPNEMYAVQIADDGNGNFQRYKYKVRHTSDGQLEAIPGTIEVQDANVDDLIEKDTTSDKISVNPEIDNIENYHEEQNEVLGMNSVKLEEIHDSSADESDLDDEEYGTPEYLLSENEFEDDECPTENMKENDFDLQLQSNFLEITPDIEEDSNTLDLDDKIEKDKKHKFFKSRDSNGSSQLYNIKNNKLDNSNTVTVYKGDKKLSYLLIDAVEKENVELSEANHFSSTKSSRSILKNSFLLPVEDNKKNNKTTIRMLNNNKNIETKDAKADKNISRENKIADKSVRQPRKQTIKPVERFGSEIIVQPVFYSFNEDFAEGPELIPKKRKYNRTSVTEVVKVSDDSDPDYTDHPKPKKRKSNAGRKSLKQKKVIEISDDDNSSDEDSVIEVLSEEAEMLSQNEEYLDEELESDDLNKSDDITKIQEAVNDIVQEREVKELEKRQEKHLKEIANNEKIANDKSIMKKNNIKCPICPKTFPREINLKTHMNIHTARRSLRAKNTEKTETKNAKESKTETPKKLEKFYCTKCKLKFLTEMQLKRHLTVHKERKNIPGLTPKKLLVRKSTVLPLRRSVNKGIPTRSKNIVTKVIDASKVITSPRRPFKCDQCPQSFSQRILLATHISTHKKFPCTKCNILFTTKSLLDDHLKKKCTKFDSFKRKSIVRSPKKRLTQAIFNCNNCKIRFRTLDLLKQHEIKEHKKQVPRKSMTVKSVAQRSKRPHGGVAISERLQKAFHVLKGKS